MEFPLAWEQKSEKILFPRGLAATWEKNFFHFSTPARVEIPYLTSGSVQNSPYNFQKIVFTKKLYEISMTQSVFSDMLQNVYTFKVKGTVKP